MFSKLHSVRSFSNEKITLNQLVDIVRNNSQKKLIDEIRSIEKKSSKYNSLKLKINCITPHTIQKGLKSDDIVSLSGYLYYDIDNFSTKEEMDDTIKRLNDTFPISFISKSVGGMGISILIKVDDTNFELNDTNFISVYQFVRSLLIDKGFNIDMYAGGISRKMNISSDEECIFNDKVSLGIDKVSLRQFEELRSSSKNKKQIRVNNTTPNDTLSKYKEVIPQEELSIKTQTSYDKNIDGDFVIDSMDYYTILLPKIIKDGFKNRLYTRIINGLYFINPSITRLEIYSYLHHLNKTAQPPMNEYKLKQLVEWLCNEIETTGEVRIKPRIKRIHFNKNSNITKKEKQSMGAKVTAAQKTNNTIQKIIDARNELWKKNLEPTQKLVCEITNISIATVKRNWRKAIEGDFVDINEVLCIKEDTGETLKEEVNVIPTIEEEDFWDGFSTKIKYVEPDDTDSDWGESDGIDGIIESYDL